MLNPKDDRLDYGGLLAPPDDYKLDFAVGTTYSLDLDALVGASLSLGLSEETDSELAENPICLLEALRATGDKLAVFCEGGQIHKPGRITPLYILLEKTVFPVITKRKRDIARYPSFHPKVWLIKYINNEKGALYRVLVMSRNLTFDHSWDVVFKMDGEKVSRAARKNDSLCDFLTYLCQQLPNNDTGKEKKRSIRQLIRELPYVRFEIDEKEFDDYEFLPHGIKKSKGGFWSIRDTELFQKKFHDLFIVSPFLSKGVMKEFDDRGDSHIENTNNVLITRTASLAGLEPEDVSTFRTFVMKDEVIDGDSAMSQGEENFIKQDIHAKIYMTRKDSRADLYLGSLNASHNAVYGNVEFMIKLKSWNRYLNTDSLMEAMFLGAAEDVDCPFREVEVGDFKIDPVEEEKKALDQIIKEINRSGTGGSVTQNGEAYDLNLEFGVDLDKYADYKIMISPMLLEIKKPLQNNVVFSGLRAEKLSEFFVITVSYRDQNVQRMITIPIEGFPEDREHKVVSSVIDSRDSFYRYIAFLLGDNMILSSLEIKEIGKIDGKTNTRGVQIAPAVYEKMLQTAAKNPEKLKGIGYLLKMVSEDGVIPDEFISLYERVKKVVGLDA